jgi:hypothetical protein
LAASSLSLVTEPIRCAGMPCPSGHATTMLDGGIAFRSVSDMTFILTPHLQRHTDTLVIMVPWMLL